MRYRPFGRSGVATSCVALSLTDKLAGRSGDALRQLIYVGLEAGVNAYHIAALDPEIPRVLGDALSVIERRLVFVSLQLGVSRGRVGDTRNFSPETLTATVDQVLNASQLGHLDLVVLDDPGVDELSRASLDALKALRASGRVSLLGVSGQNEAMDAYVSTNAFDVLVTPYHLRSGWKERNRLKAAVTLDMGVVAYDWFPEEFATASSTEASLQPRSRGLFGGRAANSSPLDGVGSYRFLHDTKNWTAEEICLAYCLTEPSLATVLVESDDPEHLSRLAAVPDREMPPGLAAQVEMARFAPMSDKSAAG
jgi:aryl-alcohol dehydrogenase-like predicted oxidoreductase